MLRRSTSASILTVAASDIDDDTDRIREGGDGQIVGLSYRTIVAQTVTSLLLLDPTRLADFGPLFLDRDTIATAAVRFSCSPHRRSRGVAAYFTFEQRFADSLSAR
jgi:hypothetical protein